MLFGGIIKYINLIIIVSLVTLLTYLYFCNRNLESRNQELIEKLYNKQAVLDFQSKQIEQQKIDIEKYKNQKPIIKEKIITKYKDKVVYDNTCESKLKAYETLLETFKNEK